MNRVIKFRGKLSHSGTWEYGNLIINEYERPYIYPNNIVVEDGHHLRFDDDNAHWVIPETVGQFTGLHDKNGKEIYEGDIVGFANCMHVVYIGEGYNCVNIDSLVDGFPPSYKNIVGRDVIGNIHDNPELYKH